MSCQTSIQKLVDIKNSLGVNIAATQQQISDLRNTIATLQNSLVTINANIATEVKNITLWCGDKPDCGIMPWQSSCYSQTHNPADQNNQQACTNSKNALATYRSQQTSTVNKINNASATIKNLMGSLQSSSSNSTLVTTIDAVIADVSKSCGCEVPLSNTPRGSQTMGNPTSLG